MPSGHTTARTEWRALPDSVFFVSFLNNHSRPAEGSFDWKAISSTIRRMGMEDVELVMAIEEEFGCAISDGDAAQMATPRDIVDWLERADREDRILHKLIPKPAPEGWWAKIGYKAPSYEIKDWWSATPRPLPREFIREKIFEIIRDHLAVTEVWEDARFVEDLKMG